MHVEAFAQVHGEPLAPRGEVGEHQHPFARREHRLEDLVETGQLARPALDRTVVVGLEVHRVVADLLERGDRGQDGALALRRAVVGGFANQVVEHGLVEADLFGGHRTVVELVDAIGQLGGDGRLELWCGGTRGCR